MINIVIGRSEKVTFCLYEYADYEDQTQPILTNQVNKVKKKQITEEQEKRYKEKIEKLRVKPNFE